MNEIAALTCQLNAASYYQRARAFQDGSIGARATARYWQERAALWSYRARVAMGLEE